MRITPVILCGGSGTRLWPVSRANAPKPFLPLVGEETLFEEALRRCSDPSRFDAPLVVTGAAQIDLAQQQAPGVAAIVEPERKNTAAAIALAAHRLAEDAVMLACPSDHHIADTDAFLAAVDRAAALAGQSWLVSLTIAPTRPETGYGYLKRGEAVSGGWRIDRFVEKPDRTRAEAFLAEGGYCWNAGIFAFRAGTYLAELEEHRPALAQAVAEAVAKGREAGTQFHPDPAAFARIEAESVDYAVMEETSRAALVEADMGWSDIGNWEALRDARGNEADADGNIARGEADLLDCRKVMVDSDGPRVSVVGLEDVIVVVKDGEVLVTSGEGAANVGKLKGPQEQ